MLVFHIIYGVSLSSSHVVWPLGLACFYISIYVVQHSIYGSPNLCLSFWMALCNLFGEDVVVLLVAVLMQTACKWSLTHHV